MYWTARLVMPSSDKTAPWSIVPNDIRPLGPAIASIRPRTASPSTEPEASDSKTAGSNRPSWDSRSLVTSANALAVSTRTWVTTKSLIIVASP